ncbi:STAS domain-containing protein [Streptomyces sp. NPDC059828]
MHRPRRARTDLSGVTVMDSVCLNMPLRLRSRAEAEGSVLTVCHRP